MKLTVKAINATLRNNTKWWQNVAKQALDAERRVQPLLRPLAAILSVPHAGLGQPTVSLNYANVLLVEVPVRNFRDVLPLLEDLENSELFGLCDESEDNATRWGGDRQYAFHFANEPGVTTLRVKAYPNAEESDNPEACRLVQIGERTRPPEPVYALRCG